MMPPPAANFFRQSMILAQKCSGTDAIMQAEMNPDIITAPSLNYTLLPYRNTISLHSPQVPSILYYSFTVMHTTHQRGASQMAHAARTQADTRQAMGYIRVSTDDQTLSVE